MSFSKLLNLTVNTYVKNEHFDEQKIRSQLNKYNKLKIKHMKTKASIEFLVNCKKKHLIPNFIKIKTSISNTRTSNTVRKAQNYWLKQEINYAHSKLNFLDCELYTLHNIFTYNVHNTTLIILYDYFNHITKFIKNEECKKKTTLKRKLNKLLETSKQVAKKCDVKLIDDFVVNKSTTQLTQDEHDLLNMGLNFAIKPKTTPLEQIIAEVETTIDSLETEEQNAIRRNVSKAIDSLSTYVKPSNNHSKKHQESLKSLRNKMKNNNIIILKSDKGNKVVVMDRSDYMKRVNTLIDNDSYVKVNKAQTKLNNWMAKVKLSTSECKTILSEAERSNLLPSNFSTPKLYALPKIHKEGPLKMRPICSGIGSPSHKLASWLCDRFTKFQQPNGFYVKNTTNFVELVKDIVIPEDHILISIDIENMYGSIPINEAENSILNWLDSLNLDCDIVSEYMHLVHLCLSKSYVQFNNEMYEQVKGLAMGNPLSSFAANCFMSEFERKAKDDYPEFPPTWIRYVDDTFIVIHKEKIDHFISFLNAIKPGIINFTFEREINSELNFLDLTVTRKSDNTLKFKIHRKNTNTDRCIPTNSYHSKGVKYSALNSYCYRAVNIPMDNDDFENEVNKIHKIANTNGYNGKIVNSLIKKHNNKKNLNNVTTLDSVYDDDDTWYTSLTFVEGLSNKIGKIFDEYNIKTSSNSAGNKLKNLIGTIKDKTHILNKSGIYSVLCQDCNKVYVGKTKRCLSCRFNEHYRPYHLKRNHMSTPADHMIDLNHSFAGFRLLKQVNNERFLDAFEKIYIYRTKNASMNRQIDFESTTSSLYSHLKPLTADEIFKLSFE